MRSRGRSRSCMKRLVPCRGNKIAFVIGLPSVSRSNGHVRLSVRRKYFQRCGSVCFEPRQIHVLLKNRLLGKYLDPCYHEHPAGVLHIAIELKGAVHGTWLVCCDFSTDFLSILRSACQCDLGLSRAPVLGRVACTISYLSWALLKIVSSIPGSKEHHQQKRL